MGTQRGRCIAGYQENCNNQQLHGLFLSLCVYLIEGFEWEVSNYSVVYELVANFGHL